MIVFLQQLSQHGFSTKLTLSHEQLKKEIVTFQNNIYKIHMNREPKINDKSVDHIRCW